MMRTIQLAVACVAVLVPTAGQLQAGVIVVGANTNGGTVDFTSSPFGDFVHFTGTASNTGGSVVPTLNAAGIPNTSVTSGTSFGNFSDTYSNGGGSGEISAPDNPFAVRVLHGGGPTDPNSRLWFGGFGSTDSAGFDLTLQSSEGTLVVYAGGFTNFNGGGLLSAQIGASSDSASILRNLSGEGQWAGGYTVTWAGESIGNVLSVSLINIPASGFGNTGFIAAGVHASPVPEPSSLALLTIGAIGLFGYGWRRKRKQAA